MNSDNIEFSNWFNEHYALIVNTCSIIAFDKATGKKAVDEAIKKLFIKWDSFQTISNIASPEHWVYREALSKIISKNINISNHIDLSIEELLSAFYVGIKKENNSKELKKIDITLRAIIVLNEYLGFTFDDISYILRIDKESLVERWNNYEQKK